MGTIAWILTFFALPTHFPYPSPDADPSPESDSAQKGRMSQLWLDTKSFFRRVDIIGSFLTLSACSFIIAALQEGNSEYAWNSGLVIAFFVVSGVSWILFIWWEWFICHHDLGIIPMFPWWLTRNRIFMGVVLYVSLSLDISSSKQLTDNYLGVSSRLACLCSFVLLKFHSDSRSSMEAPLSAQA